MPVTLNPPLAMVLLCDHAILHLDRHFPYGPASEHRGQLVHYCTGTHHRCQNLYCCHGPSNQNSRKRLTECSSVSCTNNLRCKVRSRVLGWRGQTPRQRRQPALSPVPPDRSPAAGPVSTHITGRPRKHSNRRSKDAINSNKTTCTDYSCVS